MKVRDRDVAGIRCTEVLEKLSAYLDGELADADVTRIDEHLQGCTWCERFGGRFAAAIAGLRLHLQDAEPLPPIVRKRLSESLRAEAARPSGRAGKAR